MFATPTPETDLKVKFLRAQVSGGGVSADPPGTAVATPAAAAAAQRWDLMVLEMMGQPLPLPPLIEGRRITALDEPLSEDELELIDDPTELALLAGTSKQAAVARLQKRKEINLEPRS